ncbi:hypothetical protein [Salana multivorans]
MVEAALGVLGPPPSPGTLDIVSAIHPVPGVLGCARGVGGGVVDVVSGLLEEAAADQERVSTPRVEPVGDDAAQQRPPLVSVGTWTVLGRRPRTRVPDLDP